MPQRKLGRRPASNKRALLLGPALTGIVPAHPTAADHFAEVSDWGLYENDRFGDCGPTSVANYGKLITRYLSGAEVTVSQAAVFDLYRRSGNPTFDPATGAGDDGVDMQTMLEAVLRGFGPWVSGQRGLPVAFAKVQGVDELRAAIAIFGGVLLGVNLDVAQQQQTDNGGPWDYLGASPTWGGHAIVAGRYTSASAGTDVSVVSWAEVLGTTDRFLAHQLDETWVLIFPEHLTSEGFQQGVDVATLAADYEALTGRTFPVPEPPAPTPSPVPVGPVPGVDPLDTALAAAFRADDWIGRRHTGDNHHVQLAARAWLSGRGL